MRRLFRQRSKPNRRAQRLLIVSLVSTLLLVTPALHSSVAAQSCTQGGSSICGPFCPLYFDIMYDGNFEQTSCTKWQFGSSSERAYGTWLGSTSHFGRFNGPSGWRAIRQTTTTQPVGGSYGDGFSFSYDVEINDPLNNPLTRLEVWIIEPNSLSHLVDRISGAQGAQVRGFNLGNRPGWMGKNLRVEFRAYQPGNSTISIDYVTFWQGP